MKRVTHIATAVLLVSLLSCQKEEFKEAYQQKEDTLKARLINPSEDDNNTTTDTDAINNTPEGQPSSLKIDYSDDINIMVKEISDGDDEADGGDDSRERE